MKPSGPFESRYAVCAGREIHFTDWGLPESPAVIAWHGLARTGRDMDALAGWLVDKGYRVICPDTLGRGLSQWSPCPEEEYRLAFYAQQALELLNQLRIDEVHWIGTSMGGALGTVCAATVLSGRINSLLLNDNAPELDSAAIARIRDYAGSPPAFASMLELEAFFRRVYAPFGDLSDVQWRHLTETSMRRLPNGQVTPHYDPAMVQQFIHHPNDYRLWAHYDMLRIPVLCLRGEHSDLVTPPVLDEMHRRGPGARGLLRVEEIAGCGHAPALNVEPQLALVSEFLAQTSRLCV
jgi:pimeloyl-ACP methyl ester carboxylesterase